MFMPHLSKRALFSLFVFLIGLTLTIIALQFSSVNQFITKIVSTGAIGAFIGGILYAFAFTSSLATALFMNISGQLNPMLAAVIGGLGATVYDISVFSFFRHKTADGFLHSLHDALERRRRLPNWLSLIIGIAILGSPIPDELAAGFLGFMKLSVKRFIIISFLANTFGLYLIAVLH